MRDGIKNEKKLSLPRRIQKNKAHFQDKITDDGLTRLFEHNLTAEKYHNFPENYMPEMLEVASIKIRGFSTTVDQCMLQDMRNNFQTRGLNITGSVWLIIYRSI
jgi:hypothetical protein